MHKIETLKLKANGLDFTARACGNGNSPLVLCLHGFPDSAYTWDVLLPELAAAGYRAIAPFARGYAPTQVPSDGDYSAPTLGLDVIGLADALGTGKFHIIGHDWGAVMAYAAAAYAPERVISMVTAAVPPLRRFLLNMRPKQMGRSWYIGFFQMPWVPEQHVKKDNCAFIDQLWRAWSPDWEYSEQDIAPVKAILSQRENCKAALGYYRALPWPLVNPRAGRERSRLLGTMHTPTRVISGEQDGAMGPEQFIGTESCFDVPSELLTWNAGHFMHREYPEKFRDAALEFLAKYPS